VYVQVILVVCDIEVVLCILTVIHT